MAIRNEEKKHLSAKGMLREVRLFFKGISIPLKNGAGNKPVISLADCLMSGLAVFSLKFPLCKNHIHTCSSGIFMYFLFHCFILECAYL